MGITNLEEQFTFYAAYHHSPVNKLIHILCVWPILWSAFVLAEYIPIKGPAPLGALVGWLHPLNATFLVALFYAGVYIAMDRKAGSLGAFLVLVCLVTGRNFYLRAEVNYGWPAWQLAAGINVACWIAQFVGHGVFEGRSPALLDNLFQAFVMAPLFVLLEVLFNFGYKKNFQRRMWAQVEKEIAKFKASSGAVKGGKGQGKRK